MYFTTRDIGPVRLDIIVDCITKEKKYYQGIKTVEEKGDCPHLYFQVSVALLMFA